MWRLDLCNLLGIDGSNEAEGVALGRPESNAWPCSERVGFASEMQVEEQKQEEIKSLLANYTGLTVFPWHLNGGDQDGSGSLASTE